MSESLLEIIFDEYNANCGGVYAEDYAELTELLKDLPFQARDAIISVVTGLCYQHEKRAFIVGLKSGTKLAQELT